MVFEICVAIATFVFVILAYFIVQTLKVIQKSLKDVNATMIKLESKVDELKTNVNEILINSNTTIEKINDKLDTITPVVDLFSQVGEVGQEALGFCESQMGSYFHNKEKVKSNWEDKISDVSEIINLGIKVFQKIKKRN